MNHFWILKLYSDTRTYRIKSKIPGSLKIEKQTCSVMYPALEEIQIYGFKEYCTQVLKKSLQFGKRKLRLGV